ncbi:MAG: YfcC family protein [Chthoniobacterales bacterium]|nr:YfcC family protein [Chthoniobacterales bacterium]
MKTARFPDALVLVFALVVVAQLCTYFIPAGQFDREEVATPLPAAREVLLPEGTAGERRVVLPAGTAEMKPGRRVEPGTFKYVEAERLPWHAALTKIPVGMEKSAEIIFFVLIVGGVIAVIRSTGAIDAFIGMSIEKLGHNPVLLTGGMMTLFAIGSSTVGMAEEYMPFIPILVAMCISLKMDAIVAMGIVYIGAGVGYGCAALNPFTVVIAKDIAGQSPGTGMWLRWGLLAVMIAIGLQHLLAYAKKIRRDPSLSLVGDVDYSAGFIVPENVQLTPARVVILAAFAAMVGLFIWGVSVHGWYLVELAALFLGMALVAAVIGRVSPNAAARSFVEGAAQLSGTAILIGFARTIEVVLSDAGVIDTIINGIAHTVQLTSGLGAGAAVVAAWGMLLVQSVCNFLIPSGSGQAYVTMPIMAPLADLTNVGRETAVLAYQFGDGFTNMIVPTNALLMGMLLLARVPYQRWLRFILPLMAKIYLVALVVLAITALMKFQ